MVEMSWDEYTKSETNKSKDSHEIRTKTKGKCNFRRLWGEVVRNYFSVHTVKKHAGYEGTSRDYSVF